jgi:hypothetical protein
MTTFRGNDYPWQLTYDRHFRWACTGPRRSQTTPESTTKTSIPSTCRQFFDQTLCHGLVRGPLESVHGRPKPYFVNQLSDLTGQFWSCLLRLRLPNRMRVAAYNLVAVRPGVGHCSRNPVGYFNGCTLSQGSAMQDASQHGAIAGSQAIGTVYSTVTVCELNTAYCIEFAHFVKHSSSQYGCSNTSRSKPDHQSPLHRQCRNGGARSNQDRVRGSRKRCQSCNKQGAYDDPP